MPNLIDELSPAKERRLNQFVTAVLIRCGNVVKFDTAEARRLKQASVAAPVSNNVADLVELNNVAAPN